MAADYKVKLRSISTRNLVTFDVTPDLVETRNVEYKQTNLMHTPGGIFTYGFTHSREFALSNIKFVSRTPQEAYTNMVNLQVLRSWTESFFGINSSTLDRKQRDARVYRENTGQFVPREPGTSDLTLDQQLAIYGEEKLGAPPEILYLYAYAKEVDQQKGSAFTHQDTLTNLQHIPVVMTNLSITYPSDVDYIPTATGEPFPTIMTISMTLNETHSPREYSNFNLAKFKAGVLDDF